MTEYPSLPAPCAFGAAAMVGNVVYLAGGQNGQTLDTAMNNFWSLDLNKREKPAEFVWKQHRDVPWSTRALNITVAQHNGFHDCVYIISGRRQEGDNVQFLTDVWEYAPATDQWRQRRDVPRWKTASTG